MASQSTNLFHYLPIDRRSVRWDLYVTGVGQASIVPGDEYPPPGHPDLYEFDWRKGRVLGEYQVIYLTAGAGLFESAATGEVEVKAGDVLLLFPGVWHRYRPGRGGWSELWVGLNGEYIYRLAQREVISPARPVLRTGGDERLLEFYQRIWQSVDHSQEANSAVLSAYALAILALAVERGEQPATPAAENTKSFLMAAGDPLIAQALKMIWTHSHRNTVVDDLVAALPVTRRTLERKFMAVVGRSIGQEITRCRIDRAKHLLIETDLPLAHVALAAGFSGADRMGKVFQRVEGLTPGRFRRRNRRA